MQPKILVIGSEGQLGTELVPALKALYGAENVVCGDLRNTQPHENRIFEELDVLNIPKLSRVFLDYNITHVYHLAAVLSATGEKDPHFAWKLNMEGLLNVLDLSVKYSIKQVYWPSSIAAFGPNTPRIDTPQYTVMDPNTIYGVSKLSGELWCQYYYQRYGLDVRSLRYPGIISYKSPPGGGTTDYAVDIFIQALKKGQFTCFLSKHSSLPMMYIDDAVNATLSLMQAPIENIKIRTSYNIAAISFDPETLAKAIQKHIPSFTIAYEPDFRQKIADSWPSSIDDSAARTDWGWNHKFNLDLLVQTMLNGLKA